MAIALPASNAVIARFPEARIHLAAWGSIVLPISLMIEAPVIMMLAASTALCSHRQAFNRLWRFMMLLGAGLTLIHTLIAFTPFFDLVVVDLMGAPERIQGPSRVGLQLMTPWTWAIAHRRFYQGILIRNGHPGAVGIGSVCRILATGGVLAIGWFGDFATGIAVGAAANSTGAVVEMVFIRAWVEPVQRQAFSSEEASSDGVEPLTWTKLGRFYVPLSLTSILSMTVQPLIGGGMLQMPNPIASTAVWPVTRGLLFVLYSTGMAYKEVVVSLLDRDQPIPALRNFTLFLVGSVTGLLFLTAATPLSTYWFYHLNGLELELIPLARGSLWFSVLIPGLIAMANWYQGLIVYDERTVGIIESMALFLGTVAIGIGFGMWQGMVDGLYIGLGSYTAGRITQVIWLWYRSRDPLRKIRAEQVG